jgi:tetratricopeptide (TPR) repeat protein
MIYFFIVITTLVYFFFLTINKTTKAQPQDKKIKITLSIFLSLIIIYVFSNSYDYSNSKAYKSIYSKNLSVRNNIKTIKDNVPMLESKLLNNPDDFNGWLMLGKSYSILKNYQKASRAYQIAINLRPNNMDAIKEYILVLRSDSETINKELIKKYFNIYLTSTNDAQGLLDQLSFSFTINDNSLAQKTLNKIIKHPDIKNKIQYKDLLSQLKDNSSEFNFILDIRVSTNMIYQGYFFMILKEINVDQPFAIKRISANQDNISVNFTKNDFMIKENMKIPNKFDFVIKHSNMEKFSSENKPIEVFKMTIEDYASVKDSILKVSF